MGPQFGTATRSATISATCMVVPVAIGGYSMASEGCGKAQAATGGCCDVLAATRSWGIVLAAAGGCRKTGTAAAPCGGSTVSAIQECAAAVVLLLGILLPTMVVWKPSLSSPLSPCKTNRNKRTTTWGCWPKDLRCLS
ncbi:unnamed protein product [Prunus armeniaca]